MPSPNGYFGAKLRNCDRRVNGALTNPIAPSARESNRWGELMNLNHNQSHVDALHNPSSDAEIVNLLVADQQEVGAIAKSLPNMQRARIAQYCYQRVHMRELGLKLASGCDLMTLRSVFGRAGDVVYAQSRDVDKTLSALKNTPGNQIAKPITLKATVLDQAV